MKPTEEQIKEFWEGYGFRESNTKGIWWYPAGGATRDGLPDLDLNNLFKYAVPKARYYNYTIESVKLYPHFGGEDVWLADITMEQVEDRHSAECKVFTGKDKDPALALFWALWEVKEGK